MGRIATERLEKAMRECRVVVNPNVSFGRPCVRGTGIPVDVLADLFRGGDSLDLIAEDYRLKRADVERAIRFVLLYPQCHLPSFWTRYGRNQTQSDMEG